MGYKSTGTSETNMAGVDPTDTSTVNVQEVVRTQGSYQVKGVKFSASASGTTTHDVSFPHDIEILAGELVPCSSTTGDSVDFIIAPDTTIGVTPSAQSADDTVITSSAAINAYLKVGYRVKFGAGTDEYTITAVNNTDNEFTITPALTGAVSASSAIKRSVYMVDDLYLRSDLSARVGWTKIGASLVPANTTIRFVYTNNDTSAKDVILWIEFLY